MRELSLFTGAGGGLLGTKLLGFKHIGYVEYNEYCQRVIRQRIEDGILDEAPIFVDIRTFISDGYADAYQGMVDVITAGFPCQPHSTAARGRNTKDIMWSYTADAIRRIQPTFVLCENVSKRAIEMAERDILSMGYFSRKTKVSAKDLGADHSRERFWMLAYSDHEGELLREVDAEVAVMPEFCPSVWETCAEESGVDDGLAHRVDRFKAIGNGQVPAVVAAAWKILSGE